MPTGVAAGLRLDNTVSNWTNHMPVRFHYLRECVNRKEVINPHAMWRLPL